MSSEPLGRRDGGNLVPVEPIGTSPPPEPLPPGVWPIIGPELATYGVVQPIARQMGLQTLGTLHERIYAQAGYQFALDSAFIRNGIQGDIGLRYVW